MLKLRAVVAVGQVNILQVNSVGHQRLKFISSGHRLFLDRGATFAALLVHLSLEARRERVDGRNGSIVLEVDVLLHQLFDFANESVQLFSRHVRQAVLFNTNASE